MVFFRCKTRTCRCGFSPNLLGPFFNKRRVGTQSLFKCGHGSSWQTAFHRMFRMQYLKFAVLAQPSPPGPALGGGFAPPRRGSTTYKGLCLGGGCKEGKTHDPRWAPPPTPWPAPPWEKYPRRVQGAHASHCVPRGPAHNQGEYNFQP